MFSEETDGSIRLYRATDFRPYFTARGPITALYGTLRHQRFEEGAKAEHEKNTHEENDDKRPDHTDSAMAATSHSRFQQSIPPTITTKTPNPTTQNRPLRYPDCLLWAKSIETELDKIDETGTGPIRWLKPAELGILPKTIKVIQLKMTFNYKRHKNGNIEVRKSQTSLRRDLIRAELHYYPTHT